MACAALLMGAASCSESWTPAVQETGTVVLGDLETSVNDQVQPIVSQASRAEISTDAFLITITSRTDGTAYEYVYNRMPEVVTLPVGDYDLKVESHHVEKAEWENPYYMGTTTFKVEKNRITRLEPVLCKFASVGVSVSFSTELRALLGDDVTVTVIANDNGSLTYTKADENRLGYFEAVANSMTMVATLEGTVAGSYTKLVSTFTDIAAGQRRIIVYKTTTPPQPPVQTGGAEPGIGIDSDLLDVDVNGNVNTGEDPENPENPWGPEDPENPNPPTPPGPVTDTISFTSENLNLEGSNDIDALQEAGLSAVVNIKSEKGFAKLDVKIISNFLTKDMLEGVGLTDQFDLCNPGQYAEGIAGLGFPTAETLASATEVDFDITGFLPLIFEAGDHKFNITVVDKEGNEKSFTLLMHKN